MFYDVYISMFLYTIQPLNSYRKLGLEQSEYYKIAETVPYTTDGHRNEERVRTKEGIYELL